MARTLPIASCFVLLFTASGCETLDTGQTGPVTEQQMAAALREALNVGTKRSVSELSLEGGFSENPRLALRLPKSLDPVLDIVRRAGLGATVDMVEAKLNEAAENAVTKATPIFVEAIEDMTITDARDILFGGDTAATQYFHEKTYARLKDAFRPEVRATLNELGALDSYQQFAAEYAQIPIAPPLQFDPEEYVLASTLEGLFTMLAAEERRIREEPSARASELLQQVFGYVAEQRMSGNLGI